MDVDGESWAGSGKAGAAVLRMGVALAGLVFIFSL
jgi:hypothetical protein